MMSKIYFKQTGLKKMASGSSRVAGFIGGIHYGIASKTFHTSNADA